MSNIKKSNRQTANFEILNELSEYFTKYPDIRFNQALFNLNVLEVINSRINGPYVVDNHHEEPNITLKKIKDTKEKFAKQK